MTLRAVLTDKASSEMARAQGGDRRALLGAGPSGYQLPSSFTRCGSNAASRKSTSARVFADM